MTNINTIELSGIVAGDPTFTTGEKTNFIKFSVRVNRASGKGADFIPCVAFGNVAKGFYESKIADGAEIHVKGSLEHSKYKASDGTEKQVYRVVVTEEL